MATDVFVAGALHLDVVVRAPHLPALDETVAGEGVDYAFGGKGGNQAVAAAQHGARVALAGRVGNDAFAAMLLERLDAAGVDRRQVVEAPGASGMSVAIIDGDGEYGAVIVSAANRDIDPEAIAVPEATRVVLLQNEIPEAVNIAAAEAGRAMGARVILNAAPLRPMADALLAAVDLLVINRAEATALLGEPIATRADAYRAAERLGATFDLLVTLGPEGVLWRGGDGLSVSKAAHAVEAVSSHGAGDAFLGALAARLAARAEVPAALAYAQAAAALHVSAEPAERQRITPEKVRRLMRG